MNLEFGLLFAVKCGTLLLLSIAFYVFYLKGIIVEYNSQLVDTSLFEEKVPKEKFPTMTFCMENPFKTETLKQKYNMTPTALFKKQTKDQSQNLNYLQVWNDAVYVLNRDYDIEISKFDGGSSKGHLLTYGLNRFDSELIFKVKKMEGNFGSCTVVEPENLYFKPTQGLEILLTIKPNTTSFKKLFLGISSSPWYYLDKSFPRLPGVQTLKNVYALDETGTITVFYDEIVQSYVKDCSDELSVFESFARRLIDDVLNCSQICISKSLASIMETMEHDAVLKPCVTVDEFICMEEQIAIASVHATLNSTKECLVKYPSAFIDTSPPAAAAAHSTTQGYVSIRITVGNKRTRLDEYYVHHSFQWILTTGIILRIFVGFSCYRILRITIDFIHDQFFASTYLQNDNSIEPETN